ncbi:VQ motif-containing protein [Quillaja saponaria]|uniref:VQ motif-containing protein n=1 Tax=Quillaja saponaria TaxID=32244 RepID=A0AAD7KQH1_QUISA|nr:VQ motif-containing protein [Quillaja saponaria]
MDNSKNRQSDHLGVNKLGKNIRKSPLHQPNFGNNATRQQPQPQVYNISKNEFRDIVQQLTGSPSQDPLPRPPHNPPKPQSMRLQKIRPPPLTPINRPPMPPPMLVHAAPPPIPYNNSFPRPAQFGQPSPTPDMIWANTAESPISAYMSYLQNSIIGPGPRGYQPQGQPQQQPLPHPNTHLQWHPHPHAPGYIQAQPPSSGLLPNPPMPAFPSPRLNGPNPPLSNLPYPQSNGPALLPSPTSQFLLPSPTDFLNLVSPRSSYPLFSPGVQFPPPLTPNFSFSPMGQSGILGPGPQPPLSPGLVFPLSPSGFFPISSPRWRDQ